MTDRSPRPPRKPVLVLQGCLVVALTPLVVSLGLLAIFPHPRIDDWELPNGASGTFSADGQLVVVPSGPSRYSKVGNESRTANPSISLYHLHDQRLALTLDTGLAFGGQLSPDQQLLAVAGAERTVRLYQLPDGALLHTLPAHSNYETPLLFSADGRILVEGSGDQRARVWQLPEGRLLGTYKTDTTSGVALSPDGRLLATDDSLDEIVIRTLADGQEWQRLAQDGGSRLAFSPDSQYLAVGSSYAAYGTNFRSFREEVHLWHLTSNGAIRTQVLHLADRITALAFSPDGQYVVAGGTAATQGMDWGLQDVLPIIRQVRIWRVRDGQLVQQLDLPYHSITRLAFTPDGRTLLVAAYGRARDERISRWRVQPCHPFWGWLAPLSTLGALLSWAVWRLRRHGATEP